ncbi:MAG: TIR domain-containing protein [Chloroflexi bacterium]|nr:TIR domain-containing protein [Chloroflexota bacterium]
MSQVFISYSRNDEEIARKIATDLDRLGLDVWIDTDDIPPGVNWSTAIQEGLDACEVLILILSPESMASSNVTDEWQYFRDERKPIIPVQWRMAPKVHFQLRRIQYVDFSIQEYDHALEQLRLRLREAAIPTDEPQATPVATSSSAPITVSNLRQVAIKAALTDHRDSVRGVAFSPDGVMIASCGDDKTVRLYHTTGRRRMKALIGHEKPVNAVAFSASGAFLASASEDRTIRLWHSEKRYCITALRGHSGAVTAVAYSPTDTLLASASDDGTVRLWDAKARRPIGVLGSHEGSASTIAFSPDGNTLISGGDDQTLRWWNVVDRTAGQTLTVPDSIQRLLYSPDGKLIALALNSSGLLLVDVASQRQIESITYSDYNANCVRGLAFSPDGKLLVATSLDGMIRVWSTVTLIDGKPSRALRSLQGHEGGVTGIALSADGTLLASSSHDGTVRLWAIKR